MPPARAPRDRPGLPRIRTRRGWLWAALPPLAAGCLVGAAYAVAEDPRLAHAEGGPIETTQVVLWGLAGLLALAFAAIGRDPSRRWTEALLAMIAAAAVARELDAHVFLNPETLGSLGVRYRIDWWLDGSVPILLKAAWAGAAVVAVGLAVLAVAMARPQPLRQLRRGDGPTWLFAAAGAFLVAGYAADDLLGRGQFVPVEVSQGIEESVELIGVAYFVACVVLRHLVAPKAAPGAQEPAPSVQQPDGRRVAEELPAIGGDDGHDHPDQA